MYNNLDSLYGVTGRVAEILTPHRAIVEFDLQGVRQTALLRSDKFYKEGKRSVENLNINKFIKVGNKVKFSCRLMDNPGPCDWFINNCWRHIESERNTVEMLTGMTSVPGIVTDLKQRHGTLLMTDFMGKEYKIHFLASKVYLFGKRLAASKSLSSQLQIDDVVRCDAVPCFPEENDHKCSWFATCVTKGKKPEHLCYKDQNKNLVSELRENDSPSKGVDPIFNLSPDHRSATNLVGEDVSDLRKKESLKNSSKIGATMLQDIKLLMNKPKSLFAKSRGIIMDIINEEYGVILGEFQRNNFQTILFHRSNAFLFKMNLASSKLSEIFIEGDRVRFIAVEAPKQFVCDWIATQVSVAGYEEEKKENSEEAEEYEEVEEEEEEERRDGEEEEEEEERNISSKFFDTGEDLIE